MGGTFEILHIGHERLLARAFHLGKFVFIGVSGDSLVPSLQKSHKVRPFTSRRRDLRKFLEAHGWGERAKIVELKESFGPAARRRSLSALVVSQVTKRSGLEVNSIRRTRGLPPLKISVVRMARGKDGKIISTTRIRRGEIDAQGTTIQLG